MANGTTCVEGILQISCSSEVADAAIRLIAAKGVLDSIGESHAGSLIAGQIFPTWRGYRSLDPHAFAQEILPFYRYERSSRPGTESPVSYKALVPTAAVVGDSWRWYPSSLSDENQKRVIDKAFSAFDASAPGRAETECAQYFHIRPLGIVLAHEGKNRVALFRTRELRHIPAMVSDEYYPAPERLRLFELAGAHLAVLDGKLVERVAALHLVRDLMQAYGVQIENRWPDEFANLNDVLAELDAPHNRNSWPYAADMDKLRLDAGCREVRVDATLHDIEAVALPSLRMFLIGIGLFACLALGIKLTPGLWPDLRIAFAVLTGAMGMLLTVPLLPIVRCKVGNLKERQQTNHFFDIRKRRVRELKRASDQEA
jgi:hypothetical protein